jgi:hypothetical protein
VRERGELGEEESSAVGGRTSWARPQLYRKGEGEREREPERGINGRFKAPLMRVSDGRESNHSIKLHECRGATVAESSVVGLGTRLGVRYAASHGRFLGSVVSAWRARGRLRSIRLRRVA